MSVSQSVSRLQAEFDRLGPWVTRFVIDGQAYGGSYDPYGDGRIDWFFKYFPNVERVLDLGCLEGAQSLRLAERPTVKSVLGIEGREANLARAEFVRRLYRADNVQFVQADLETADLTQHGQFDAVFCAGLLYHLPRPWLLIERIAKVTGNLYVWTHHAPDSAKVSLEGYQGDYYSEFGLADPQSGLSAKSFWLTFPSLMKALADNGFSTIHVIEQYGPTPKGLVASMAATRASGT